MKTAYVKIVFFTFAIWGNVAAAQSLDVLFPDEDPPVGRALVLLDVATPDVASINVRRCDGSTCGSSTPINLNNDGWVDGDRVYLRRATGSSILIEIIRISLGASGGDFCTPPPAGDPRAPRYNITLNGSGAVSGWSARGFVPLNDTGCCDNAGAKPSQTTPNVTWTGTAPDRFAYPMDMVLILDRSGSMGVLAGAGQRRIDVLNDKVASLVATWQSWSTGSGWAEELGTDRDGLLVVRYNSAASHDAYVIRGSWPTTFTLSASGDTSIGRALEYAKSQYDAISSGSVHPNDKVFVLVTDGQQTVAPWVCPSIKCAAATAGQIDVDGRPYYCATRVQGLGISLETNAEAMALMNTITSINGGSAAYVDEWDIDTALLTTLLHTLDGSTPHMLLQEQGSVSQQTVEHAFAVNENMKLVWVVVSWRSRNTQLDFNVVGPNGNPIATDENPRVGSTYAIKRFAVQKQNVGNWKARVSRASGSGSENYNIMVFSEEKKFSYRAVFDQWQYQAGEPIKLVLETSSLGESVAGLEVSAQVSSPQLGAGSALHQFNTVGDLLEPLLKPFIEKLKLDANADAADTKRALLRALKDAFELKRETFTKQDIEAENGLYQLLKDAFDLYNKLAPYSSDKPIKLWDDGNAEHGDAQAKDGKYSVRFTNTLLPGPYVFDLSIKGKLPDGTAIEKIDSVQTVVQLGSFRTEKLKVTQAPSKCETEADLIFAATPRDEHGNFLGPGYEQSFQVTAVLLPEQTEPTPNPDPGSGVTKSEGEPVTAPRGLESPQPLPVSEVSDPKTTGDYNFTVRKVPCERMADVTVKLMEKPFARQTEMALKEVCTSKCCRCSVSSDTADQIPLLTFALTLLLIGGVAIRSYRRRSNTRNRS